MLDVLREHGPRLRHVPHGFVTLMDGQSLHGETANRHAWRQRISRLYRENCKGRNQIVSSLLRVGGAAGLQSMICKAPGSFFHGQPWGGKRASPPWERCDLVNASRRLRERLRKAWVPVGESNFDNIGIVGWWVRAVRTGNNTESTTQSSAAFPSLR